MSADGSTVAIGAPHNTGTGHVRVYQWDGGAWVQQGDDIDGEAAGDYSGTSVSMSADGATVAIGATGNDETGSYAGHVRVYQWDGSAWVQQGDDIDGESNKDGVDGSVIPIPCVRGMQNQAQRDVGTGSH